MAWIKLSARPIILGICTTILLSAAAWGTATEVVLYNFCQKGGCADGAAPSGQLLFDAAGNLYGVASSGGASGGGGVVYELSPSPSGWTETVLYSFCALTNCADGETPKGALAFDSSGNLYGTTYSGGAYGYGAVFELSPSASGWSETVLYSFCAAGWPCPDYSLQSYTDVWPYAGVTMDGEGNLFGKSGWGSTFELSPSSGGWTKRDLYFTGNTDIAGVILDAKGDVYSGADGAGLGEYPGGYVFELARANDFSMGALAGFVRNKAGSFADGYNPDNTPVFDEKGSLYGTTLQNGAKVTLGGTAFKLSPGKKGWTLKLLHTFTGKKGDGLEPMGQLAVDSLGNVYGATDFGGSDESCNGGIGCGIVYELSPSGSTYTENILWTFSWANGAHPVNGVILDKSGNVYGATYQGGASTFGDGVVFELIPNSQ